MTKKFPLLILLAALLGLGLRCLELDLRPMHTDEAVKARIFEQLWEGGGYRYDPVEHHGPTLAYSTLVWGKLTNARDFARWSEDRFRGLTILFGIGLILLLPLVSDGLGRNATLAAALLTAVSPVMVYYSRDYIHEMLLVFFTFLALAAAWRYSRERKIGWIVLAGAAVGLMQATKETFVFNLAAAAGAWLLNLRFAPQPVKGRTTKPIPRSHLVAAAVAWLTIWELLFSSFLTYPTGPLDAVRTYLFWGNRAGGASLHVHGWGFYWHRLLFFHVQGGPVWSEGLILALAVVAGAAVFARRELPGTNTVFARFILFYTVILAAIYTVLPYKTPWCALGFWHGAILLAGIGAVTLLAWLPTHGLKMAAGILLLAGTGHLAFQAWQSDVNFAADQRNPWNYAQTSPDLLNLVNEVESIAQVSPEGNGVGITVIAPDSDYYPLPWYFRSFGHTAWWPEVPGYSKFAMGDKELDAETLAARLRGRSDPISRYLMDTTLGKYVDTTTPSSKSAQELETIFVTNFNRLLMGPSLYDSNRFQNVRLRPETQALRDSNPEGQDLIRLNRMLLEDAYTNEIAMNLPPDEIYRDITIVSTQLEPDIDTNKAGVMARVFELRPGTFLDLYVKSNLWSAYLHRPAQ